MAKIIHKKSAVVGKIPATADLDYGELALNYADGKLFYKASNNTIQSFGGAALSSVVRQQFTATAGQTNFTLTYTPGQLDVYLNGVKLVIGTDYTASSGTGFTLAAAAAAGDIVDVVAGIIFASSDWQYITNKPTTISGFGITDAQPLSTNLTSISALTGTSGFLKTNGAGTYSVDANTYITGNQNIVFSGDATGNGTTSVSLTLANSGVTAGTYTKVMVDAKGRVTNGYSLTSADLPTYTGTITSSQVTTALGFTPYNATNPSGYISGNQTITFTGDATGSGATSVALTLANSGVTAGTYGSSTAVPVVVVDAKGRVTSISTQSISGSLTFTGDVTGTGTTGSSTALTLANSGVTAGTYTKITVDAKGRATSGTTLSASDIPNLDASKIISGTIDAARLPSYVDDVLEYTNLASFPATGETGKIYLALDTNKAYRWSGSAYVYITSGAVDSVAGKTGVVTLTNADVGLGNVENKSSATIRGELTSANVTTALGFTPYNSTNPSGYITSSALSSYLPLSGGTTTGSVHVGAAIGSRGTSLSVSGSNASSPFAAKSGSYSTVFAMLPWASGQTYLSTGTYYDGSSWVHASSDTTNALFAFSGGSGAIWYASNNSSPSWNTASAAALWNQSGTWTGALNASSGAQVAGNTIVHAGNYSSYALPLTGGTLTGNLNMGSQVINFAGQSDSLGYNSVSGLGMYIKGTGSTYVYGGGSFYDGSSHRVLLHAGNVSTYALPISGGTLTGQLSISTSSGESYLRINRSSTSAGQVGIQLQSAGTSKWWMYLDQGNDNILRWYNSIGSLNVLSLDTAGNLGAAGNFNASGTVYGAGGVYKTIDIFDAPGSPGTYVWVRAAMGQFNGGGNTVRFSIQRSINDNGNSPYGGPSADFEIHSREWHGGQESCTVYYSEHGSGSGTGGQYISHAGPRDLAGNGYWFYMRLEGGIRYIIYKDGSSGYLGTFASTTDPGSVPVINGWGFNVLGNATGIWSGTNAVLHAGNVSTYALPISGGTLTGAVRGTQLTVGGSTNTDANLGVQGTSHLTGTVYWGGTVGNVNSWSSLQTSSAGTQTFSGSRFIFDRYGYGSQSLLDLQLNSITLAQPTTVNSTLNVTGNTIRQGNNLARPLAQWGATGATGMVFIEFPGTTSNYGMIHAVVDIYEYNSNNVCTVVIGGHNWNGAWYNIGCNVIGFTDKPVRLGVRGGKYVICIGNSSSSWSYGQVMLRKINNGPYYDNIMDMGAQFVTNITTSESLSWDSGDLRALRTPANFNAGGAITQNGNQVLHAGNFTNYAPGSGSSWTFGEVYSNGWFRNNNSGQGLYNQATGNHFYSDGQYWNVGYSGTTGIRFRNGYAGTTIGWIYAQTDQNWGLLTAGGSWAVQIYPGGGGNLNGSWTIGGSTPLTAANYTNYITPASDSGPAFSAF